MHRGDDVEVHAASEVAVDLVSENEDLRVLCSVAVCVLAGGRVLKSCGHDVKGNEDGTACLVRSGEAWSPLYWLEWECWATVGRVEGVDSPLDGAVCVCSMWQAKIVSWKVVCGDWGGGRRCRHGVTLMPRAWW